VNRPHPPSLDNKQFILAKVFDNKRITAEDHFQDVRHIELKLPSKILYRPGDILQIMPENRKEDVDELINLLNWQDFADGSIIRAIISGENEVIMLTVRQWLVHLLDAFSPPKDEYFFELLYHFATDPIEKERLYEFTSPEGQEDLYDYCYRARRTAFEILTDFRSVRIPLKYLLDLFPMMRPRDFSISNYNQFTGSSNNNTVTITAGILQYNTIMKKSRIGLCSGYLCRIKPQGSAISWIATN
jgi:sulfite reductase alpha subunit-like flavoprotein